ncbi:class I SAM-dependent methyltransferase [Candidatus Woesearchaeota archaeon]|nr:class I SAM-dependent methyltransferase [Candidatus Woesearchaeota archaeon]
MEIDWYKAFLSWGGLEFSEKDFNVYFDNVKNNDLYKKYLKKGARVLDVGIGPGCSAIPLSLLGYSVTGIDNDKRVIDGTRKNINRFGKNIKLIHGDAFKLSKFFRKDSFDCCIHDGLMEHFPDERIIEFLQQQIYVAPLVICSIPIMTRRNKEHFVAKGDVFRDGIYRNLKTMDEWKKFLKEFSIVETKKRRASEKIGRFDELFLVIKSKTI